MTIFCINIDAQKVHGRVTGSEGGQSVPLASAYVIWAGTSHGTLTDADGNYELQIPNDGHRVLVFSFVGYEDDTIRVDAPREINVALKPVIIAEVDVSARRVGNRIDRISPQLTERISADELCKAPCCNLGESFQTNASVDVNYADAATGAKTIQLLGLQGRYVQMMGENVPTMRGIASPYGLSYIPGPWMNGIQISKGAGTVVNGFEAITGQINVEYNKPVATEERLSLNVFGSTSGRAEANGNLNIKAGKKLRLQFMANLAKDFNDTDENDDGFRDEPRVKQMSLFHRWYMHDDFHTFTFSVKTLNEERLGGQVDFDDNKPVDGLYGVYIKTDRVESWMKNGFVFSEKFNIGFPMGYTYHHQSSFFGDRSYKGTQHSYNFNSIALWDIDTENTEHQIHAGISAVGDLYRERIDYGIGELSYDRDNITFGAYGQYTFKLGEHFTTIAGIRIDHDNQTGTFVTPRLHLMYQPTHHTTIRGAIGRGRRYASIFAENNFLLTSKREWEVSDDPYGEEVAWNMGGSITQYLFDDRLTLSAEYYHTEFDKQMIVDMDNGPRTLLAYFGTQRGYADNLQIEAKATIIGGLDITTAWRYNDNELYLGGERQRRPLVSRYKALVALSYQTPLKTWQFDANMQLNGGGRIPSTLGNPHEYHQHTSFSSYQIYNAQVTKWFKTWSIYAGCENIGDFMQHHPIIAADDPQGPYFDSSLVWGPLMSRKFYIGLRWHLDNL